MTFAQQLDQCIEHALVQSSSAGIEVFMMVLLRSANMSEARKRWIARELVRREHNLPTLKRP